MAAEVLSIATMERFDRLRAEAGRAAGGMDMAGWNKTLQDR